MNKAISPVALHGNVTQGVVICIPMVNINVFHTNIIINQIQSQKYIHSNFR